MSGYWNNSVATIETLRNGWLHTGDVGYMDEDGFVYLVDRKKDMIVSGGENVYSREVEEALMSHPSVADAAVIGVPDPRWGEAVVGVVVCKPRSDRIAGRADQALPRVHRGLQVSRSASSSSTQLPRLPSGKISKVTLREQFAGPPPCDGVRLTHTSANR